MSDKYQMKIPGDQDSIHWSFYSNQFTYMNRKLSRELSDPDLDVVICGVPFDLGTSGRSGTRLGPTGIRQASSNLLWESPRWPWEFEVFDELGVIDYGDIHFDPGNSENMDNQLCLHADKIIKAGKVMLTFGGDHYVTLPLLRQHAKKYESLCVIHFDAHTDNYDEDTLYSHATIFHHAIKEDLVDPKHSVQIGIRTCYDASKNPFTVLDAAWVNEHKAAEVIDRIRQIVGTRPVYISFDIDCLDPAFAPGTGTPVVGGLSTDMALKIIRGMAGINLIGMDVVETSPPFDTSEITSLASATLALEFLYVLAVAKNAR